MVSRYVDGKSPDLLVPAPADDAAVWRGDRFVVATVDTMVEGIDFRVDWPGFSYRTLGRRLMSINLSDLAAMGAEPRHALVSLCLRRDMIAADVDRLYQGVADQARRFHCSIAGGDLSATEGPLTATATLIGRVASGRRLLKRSGARTGWQIAVTGRLGGASAGLRLLEAGRPPRTRAERQWVRAQLDPQPRIEAGRTLVRTGVTVAGDISDGLSREVEKLTEAEGLGARLEVDRLPLATGLGPDDWAMALQDSEDFELVCAAPAVRMRVAATALHRIGTALTVIGRIEAEPGVRFRAGDRPVRIEKVGYQHFR
jgi:thiamine-monophosphate kinase